MVYCHTNKVNGKKYIGITSEKYPSHRFHRGKGYKSCTVFYRAIKKYGWDSFETEILYKNLSEADALRLERELVLRYRTKEAKYGYNMVDGGFAPRPITQYGREALRQAATGASNPGARAVVAFDLSGKRLAEFECIVFAQRHFGFLINPRHLKTGYGTCHGYIFRYKSEVGDIEQLPQDQVYQKKILVGESACHTVPVTLFDAHTGEFVKSFSYMKLANEYVGANCSDCLNGKSKSVRGYICKRSEDVVGVTKLSSDQLPTYSGSGKEVNQYDLNGNFIRSYPNAVVAEQETGVSRKQISNCVRNKSYLGGGFIWKLASDTSPIRNPLTATQSRIANGNLVGTAIDQIDLNTGEVIATYPSLSRAAKEVGTYITSLRQIVDHVGNHKTAKGYGWRYHEESE